MEIPHQRTAVLQDKEKTASSANVALGRNEDMVDKQDDEILFMSGAKLYMLFLGLALAVFIMALDMV